MSEPEKTILLELRESARENRNEQYRELAGKSADALAHIINCFFHTPNRTNMIDLVGLWSLAERVLKNEPTDDPERGRQVRVESTEKIRVAA